jgi:DNA polymerase-3 subunit delta'
VKFADILGHSSIKKTLINSANSGRIPHAQMVIGSEGSSALPLAMAYAQYIACLNKTDDDSCGACSSCVKYNQLIHPDLHLSFPFIGSNETCDDYIQDFRKAFLSNPIMSFGDWLQSIDSENKRANINIKECRNIIRKLALKPYESDYKVLIMWLPEFLGKEGNVLLKLIEEPPTNTLFFLVTENQDLILSTIISRTQFIKIPAYPIEEIEQFLLNNQLAGGDLARNAALMSEGNLNKAIKLANELENPQFELFRAWMLDCYQGQIYKIMDELENYTETGKESLKMLFTYGIHMLRSAMLFKHQDLSSKLSAQELEFVGKLSNLIGLDAAKEIYDGFNKAIFEIDRNGSVKLILINLSLTLKNNLKSKTVQKV